MFPINTYGNNSEPLNIVQKAVNQKIIQFPFTRRALSCPAFMNNDFLPACILRITATK